MNIPKTLEPLSKITAIVLAVLLNGVGLMQVGTTFGFYLDVEASHDNAFIAGNVDFLATSTEWNPLHVAINMQPGDITFSDIDIDPLISNPFQYTLTATTTGDTAFCEGITTELSQDSTTLYSGALDVLGTPTTTSTSTLSLSATTGLNNFQNSVCNVWLDVDGWQTRHGYSTVGGFNDTESLHTHLASWGFRINKVYYDVAPDRYVGTTTTEGPNEWVEIYNQTNVPLDISGWEICDNTSCDLIPAGTPDIPAMGYGVIVNDPGVFSATGTAPWYLPAGVVEIVLNENIGNGLGNDSDMLILKRPDGIIVDQMNWGTPDTGWTNYNSNVWDPGATDVAEGNLLARVPSGFDTDQPSDWVELVPPIVDLIYPDETGTYTWYWGYSYTITWDATNPNGSDDDLNISLFYIKDIDHTGTITNPDTTHTIADTTANDGSYTWTVPSGFLGYIWIKLVATGPENPLNNTSTVSGLIYDPIPLFIGPEGVDEGDIENIDIEAPVITSTAPNPQVVPQGATYLEPIVQVTDNVNTNLGYTVDGDVDTETVGEYTLLYTAEDQVGNIGTYTQTVIVYDPAVGPPTLEEETVPQTEPESQPAQQQTSGGSAPSEEIEEQQPTSEEEEPVVEEEPVEEQEGESSEAAVEEEVAEEETAVEEEAVDGETIAEDDDGVQPEEVAEEGETVVEEEPVVEEEVAEEEAVDGDTIVEDDDGVQSEDIVEEPVTEEEPAEEGTEDVSDNEEGQPVLREDDDVLPPPTVEEETVVEDDGTPEEEETEEPASSEPNTEGNDEGSEGDGNENNA